MATKKGEPEAHLDSKKGDSKGIRVVKKEISSEGEIWLVEKVIRTTLEGYFATKKGVLETHLDSKIGGKKMIWIVKREIYHRRIYGIWTLKKERFESIWLLKSEILSPKSLFG